MQSGGFPTIRKATGKVYVSINPKLVLSCKVNTLINHRNLLYPLTVIEDGDLSTDQHLD